jgi:membrane protein required for colicin V production
MPGLRAEEAALLYNPRRPRLSGPLMNATDYLIIAAVCISAIVGAMRGFLREAVALVSWLVALFVAWHFSELIEPHLGGLLAGSYVKPWAARVIIVALIVLFGAALGAVLTHFVRLSIFSGLDRLLGFVFGLLRGVVLLGVFVILAQLLRLDGERWWRHSILIPYGESVANGLRALVGEPGVRHSGGVTANHRSKSEGGEPCAAS